MRLSCALLCDAATVREGLLHVLGGGVTRLTRTSVPNAMGVALALIVDQHRSELERDHRLTVLVLDADGAQIVRAEMTWHPHRPSGSLEPEYSLPVVVPLHAVVMPRYGDYSVDILIDEIHQGTISLSVVEAGGSDGALLSDVPPQAEGPDDPMPPDPFTGPAPEEDPV